MRKRYDATRRGKKKRERIRQERQEGETMKEGISRVQRKEEEKKK